MGVAISPDSLVVAENAALILPVHGMVDRAREEARGAHKIGTTGRGIGPAYEDKVARRPIRPSDPPDAEAAATNPTRPRLTPTTLPRGRGPPEAPGAETLPGPRGAPGDAGWREKG